MDIFDEIDYTPETSTQEPAQPKKDIFDEIDYTPEQAPIEQQPAPSPIQKQQQRGLLPESTYGAFVENAPEILRSTAGTAINATAAGMARGGRAAAQIPLENPEVTRQVIANAGMISPGLAPLSLLARNISPEKWAKVSVKAKSWLSEPTEVEKISAGQVEKSVKEAEPVGWWAKNLTKIGLEQAMPFIGEMLPMALSMGGGANKAAQEALAKSLTFKKYFTNQLKASIPEAVKLGGYMASTTEGDEAERFKAGLHGAVWAMIGNFTGAIDNKFLRGAIGTAVNMLMDSGTYGNAIEEAKIAAKESGKPFTLELAAKSLIPTIANTMFALGHPSIRKQVEKQKTAYDQSWHDYVDPLLGKNYETGELLNAKARREAKRKLKPLSPTDVDSMVADINNRFSGEKIPVEYQQRIQDLNKMKAKLLLDESVQRDKATKDLEDAVAKEQSKTEEQQPAKSGLLPEPIVTNPAAKETSDAQKRSAIIDVLVGQRRQNIPVENQTPEVLKKIKAEESKRVSKLPVAYLSDKSLTQVSEDARQGLLPERIKAPEATAEAKPAEVQPKIAKGSALAKATKGAVGDLVAHNEAKRSNLAPPVVEGKPPATKPLSTKAEAEPSAPGAGLIKGEQAMRPEAKTPEGVKPQPETQAEVNPMRKAGVISTDWSSGAERPFKFDPNSTKNEGRFRLTAPENIQSESYFRRKSSTKGVSYVMGLDANGKETIQAIRFDKNIFTEKQASDWYKNNAERLGREPAQTTNKEKSNALPVSSSKKLLVRQRTNAGEEMGAQVRNPERPATPQGQVKEKETRTVAAIGGKGEPVIKSGKPEVREVQPPVSEKEVSPGKGEQAAQENAARAAQAEVNAKRADVNKRLSDVNNQKVKEQAYEPEQPAVSEQPKAEEPSGAKGVPFIEPARQRRIDNAKRASQQTHQRITAEIGAGGNWDKYPEVKSLVEGGEVNPKDWTPAEQTTATAAQELANKHNCDVVFVGNKKSGIAGVLMPFKQKNGRRILIINSPEDIGHEMFHLMIESDVAPYKNLLTAVEKFCRKNPTLAKRYKANVERIIFGKDRAGREIPMEIIYEDIAADLDSGVWNRFGDAGLDKMAKALSNTIRLIEERAKNEVQPKTAKRGLIAPERAPPEIAAAAKAKMAAKSDARYLELAKEPEKNRKELQKMVDEKAKEAGYDIKGYHGTPDPNFNVFKILSNHKGEGNWQSGAGFYFTTDRENAQHYADRGKLFGLKGGVKTAWLNIKNPINIDFKKGVMQDETFSFTRKQVEKILSKAPNIKDPDGPLSNFGDIRYEGYNKIWNEAVNAYTDKGNSTIAMLNDFFSENPDLFLKTFREVTGYDGFVSDVGNHKHYVALESSQIKSADPVTYDDAGNVIPLSERFNPQREDIRFAAKKEERQKAPEFYSQLGRVIDQKMPNKISVKDLTNMIDPNRGLGIKKDEIFWSGLKDYLDSKQPDDIVTKEEIKSVVKPVEMKDITKEDGGLRLQWGEPDANGVRVADSNVGTYYIKSKRDGSSEWKGVGMRVWEYAASPEIAERRANEHMIQHFNGHNAATKFHQYQLPGGENYRELLVTLPIKPWESGVGGLTSEDLLKPGRFRNDIYKSQHWDELNVLYHVRMNDREVDGKKILHIEEIQSDWHQQGREKGYATPLTKSEQAELDALKKMDAKDFTQEQKYRGLELIEKSQKAGVPPAPFSDTSKGWGRLALKKIIRYASENGYDAITWTTGEQQAERYDLSKQVDRIRVVPYLKGSPAYDEGARYEVMVFKGDSSEPIITKHPASDSELSEIIGKDLAAKAVEDISKGNRADYYGVDLKVGGEGMKSFYDKMLPSIANDIGKKWGARVASKEIKSYQESKLPWLVYKGNELIDGFRTKEQAQDFLVGMDIPERDQHRIVKESEVAEPVKVHSMDISPAMRDSVLYEGQPMFAAKKVKPKEQTVDDVIAIDAKDHADRIKELDVTKEVVPASEIPNLKVSAEDLAKAWKDASDKYFKENNITNPDKQMELVQDAINGGTLDKQANKLHNDYLLPATKDVLRKAIPAKNASAYEDHPYLFDEVVTPEQVAIQRAAETALEAKKIKSYLDVDKEALQNYAVLGAVKIARGLKKYSVWRESMLRSYGDKIEPFLKSGRTSGMTPEEWSSQLWPMARSLDLNRKSIKSMINPKTLKFLNQMLELETRHKIDKTYGTGSEYANILNSIWPAKTPSPAIPVSAITGIDNDRKEAKGEEVASETPPESKTTGLRGRLAVEKAPEGQIPVPEAKKPESGATEAVSVVPEGRPEAAPLLEKIGEKEIPKVGRKEMPSMTQVRNENLEKKRMRLGLSPLLSDARRKNPEAYDKAVERLDENPNAARDLVEELTVKARAVNDIEVMMVGIETVSRENDFLAAQQKLFNAKTPTEKGIAKVQVDKARDRFDEVSRVARNMGTETARGLQARNVIFTDEYSLVKMESDYRTDVNDGEALNRDQEAKIKSHFDEINRTKMLWDRYVRKAEQNATKNTEIIDNLVSEIKELKSLIAKEEKAVNAAPAKFAAKRGLVESAKYAPRTQEQRLKAYKTRLTNAEKELQRRMDAGDFSEKAKIEPLKLDKEGMNLRYEYEKAKAKFNELKFKDMLKKQNIPQKTLRRTAEVVNFSRAIMTSFDLSAPLRQGGWFIMTHPLRSLKSFIPMFKAMVSKKATFNIEEEIKARPNAALYKQAGLEITERGVGLAAMEEAYMSRWADKVPIVAGSQRAYTTFLNRLRADAFDSMAANLSRRGTLTIEEARAIANYINVATGRGNMGNHANAAASLATVFFAPRLVLSRFQLLTGQPLYHGSAKTRAMIAGEYARYMTAIGTIFALAMAAGAEVELEDPTSSDWGKIKIGNTRIDLLSGLQQATVFVARTILGRMKTPEGEIVPLRGEDVPYGKGWPKVAGDFLRQKFAPAFGTVWDKLSDSPYRPSELSNLITGETKEEQKHFTVPKAILNLVMPMSFSDVYESMISNGVPAATALALLSIFGAGVRNYSDDKRKQDKTGLMSVDDLMSKFEKRSDFSKQFEKRQKAARKRMGL